MFNNGIFIALLKAQVCLQLGKVFSSDNGVSVSIMYSYIQHRGFERRQKDIVFIPNQFSC